MIDRAAIPGDAGSDHVLVVDDDPGIRRLMTSALAFVGFSVAVAGDLAEAVRGLRLGGDDYVIKPFSVVEVGAR